MRAVSKIYRDHENDLVVLRDFDMTLKVGEFVSLVGPSGSGKSTLLHIVAGLDRDFSGSVQLADKDYQTLSEQDFDKLRSSDVGMIFQDFSLLNELTAIDNVKLALLPTTWTRKEKLDASRAALEDCGLRDRLTYRARLLSGGQKQRVAVARAMVGNRKLIVADEPTANLDAQTASNLLEIMRKVSKLRGVTFLIATHDPSVMAKTDRSIQLDKGAV